MRDLIERLEKLNATWSGKAIEVELSMGKSRAAGTLIMSPVSRDKYNKCQGDIDALRGKGHDADLIFYVETVRIDEKHRGKGFGKQMYLLAMQTIAKKHGNAYVIPGSCHTRGSTTADAERVWASLRKRYPSSGKVIHVS